MTDKSFNEVIENTEPHEIRASHYALAPDAFGLDDGYAWAFSNVSKGEALAHANDDIDDNDPATGLPAVNVRTYSARHHLTDGGEWPYYIAAVPAPVLGRADDYTAAGGIREDRAAHLPEGLTTADVREALTDGRILETYCEGDLVAYIFESIEDRDEAARAWEESREEFTARILAETHPHENAANLAPAVLAEADYKGGHDLDGQELRDCIAEVMQDRYAGEWGSLADYVQEWHESTTPSREAANAHARECHEHEPQGVYPGDELWNAIDWERVARDWEQTHTAYDAPGGNVYVFRGE